MKPIIVISAINLRNGGPLSILQDCLFCLHSELLSQYKVIALVHDKTLLSDVEGIEFIEFPASASSYLCRLYYEYIYFNKLSKQLKPYLWLSLHDISPNVEADIRAVYCHNPSPFFKMSSKELFKEPAFTLFNLFYKIIYRINIGKNDYVIVQQNWLREQFKKLYKINSVVVAYPNVEVRGSNQISKSDVKSYSFVFPTLARFFKNIDVIIDAVKIINQQNTGGFSVTITVDGTENKYARQLVAYAQGVDNIKFTGRISREEVFDLYKQSDCLIFPSKLETWGLPITEFKLFRKPMLVADLPYAHETVGNYKKVDFFKADDAEQLAKCMLKRIEGDQCFAGNVAIVVKRDFTQSWSELFSLLLNK